MRVCVSYDENCVHSHSDGETGEWSASYDSSIERVYILGEDEEAPYMSETFLLPDEAETVYVVYMIYSSGDSFGHEEGRISIIHCTADKIAARTIAKMIQENPNKFSFKFVDDFGRKVSLYNPGAG
jgi:hypothetical protein